MEPPSPNTANKLRALLPWLGAVAGFFLVVFILAVTIEFLQPSLPRIHVDSVNVSSMTISPDLVVTANWDVSFSSANHNNKRILYDRLRATAMHGKKPISTATFVVSLIGQDVHDEAVFLASFSNMAVADLELVKYTPDGGGINGETGWLVRFSVSLVGDAIYRGPTWPRNRIAMEASCGEVEVVFSSNSNMSSMVVFGERRCRVDGYWRSLGRAFRIVKIISIVVTLWALFPVIYILAVLNARSLACLI